MCPLSCAPENYLSMVSGNQACISHGMWPLEMSFLIHNMNSGGISRKASHQQVVFLRRYIYTIVNTVSKVSTGREQHPGIRNCMCLFHGTRWGCSHLIRLSGIISQPCCQVYHHERCFDPYCGVKNNRPPHQ